MTPFTFAPPADAEGTSAPARAERPPTATRIDRLSAPGPCEPADVEALGDEIARLSAHMHAAEYRMLTLLREFDEREGWGPGGFRSCAHWLSWRTGLSPGPSREKVRVARELAHLPLIGARMERGQFSYSKVRALTRVATPENEAELIGFAEHATVAQVERLVRGWRRVDELEACGEEERHARRSLSVVADEDGMYVVRGRLDPEVGSLLIKALEVAGRELQRADPDATAAQRRADALGEILRSGAAPAVHALLHVSGDGGALTEEGVRVSAETSERLTCDARVTVVERAAGSEGAGSTPEPGPHHVPDEGHRRRNGVPGVGHGSRNDVLDVGRRRRTVPVRMRRALEVRDGGRCRFPGCEARRCDAHHVRHWSRGGGTKLENLVLLCRFHHRFVHEGGWRVELRRRGAVRGRAADGGGGADGATGGAGRCVSTVRFRRPDGREVPDHPRPDPVSEPGLERWHGQRAIGHETTLPRGMGGPVDYGWALEGLRAL